MSGRLIDATKANELELVHSITDGDPISAAVEFAEQFTSNSLPAMGLVRDAVLRANEQNLESGFRTETDLSTLSYQLEDSVEGVTAFLDKRKPNFQDR